MLRRFPVVGFIMVAITSLIMAFLVVYLWVAFNVLVGLAALLAAIAVMAIVAKLRRPPEVQ